MAGTMTIPPAAEGRSTACLARPTGERELQAWRWYRCRRGVVPMSRHAAVVGAKALGWSWTSGRLVRKGAVAVAVAAAAAAAVVRGAARSGPTGAPACCGHGSDE